MSDDASPTRSRVVQVNTEILDRHRILRPSGAGPSVAAHRMLRTRVLSRLAEIGGNTLAVVSPRSGDGKTATAINLAISLAADPTHAALLVDFDLRRPRVARYLGVEPEAGVEEYLRSNVPIERLLLRPDGYERFVFLPAKAPTERSSELLLDTRARALAHELKSRYENRIVVYDTPPLLEADDAIAFIRNVDAVLLVVREGHTRCEDIVDTRDLLGDVRLIGTVLNGSRERAGQYGY